MAVAVVLLTGGYLRWVLSVPATVAAASTPAGATLHLQTVAATGHQPHPDWVSYYVDASGGWRHTTIFEVPANTVVTVTIDNYDTATGLRNPFLAQPRGVVGGSMVVDGKTVDVLDPDLASHTFTVPDLGLSVPLRGVADDAPRQCAVAPCSRDEAHTTTTFRFRTGKRGWVRWQCFVPCGAGWIYGNGGPMQTMGYMDGLLHVV